MDSKINFYTKVYKDLNAVPSVSSATVLPGKDGDSFRIHSQWSAQDLVKMEPDRFSRDYFLRSGDLKVLSSGTPYSKSPAVIRAFSKSGRKQAIVTEKKSPDALYIEIWNECRKEATFDLTDHKAHGKIINNDRFGVLDLSANEQYVLYVAEAKQPKAVSYFKPDKKEDKKEGAGDEKDDKNTVKGEEYAYREEWGEQLVGSHHSVLCVLNVKTGEVEVMPTEQIGCEISIGSAIWGPSDESIVFTGWLETPRRLGLMFCLNRRSALYSINIQNKEIEKITGIDKCVRSPNFSPDFKTLVYLESERYGPHRMGAKLQKYDWDSKQHSTVIDIVDEVSGDQFPGLTKEFLQKRCWSNDGKHIFFSDFWRSNQVISCVNIENGHVQRLKTDEKMASCDVLDVFNDIIVAVASSPNIEPFLMAGSLKFSGMVSVEWKFLDENTPFIHSDITWNLITLAPSKVNETYPKLDYEIILVRPAEKKEKMPLIVIPHGGPHSCCPPAFMKRTLPFAKLGYILCYVNYRGSLGFGSNCIKSLPGNVGDQDVSDVQNAAVYVKEKCGLDVGDVFAFGGSHGGFLGAHLAGQYPEFYKAVVLLNPVIDLAAKMEATDIPDWGWVEGDLGGEYDPSVVIGPEHLKKLWEISPIRHAENIRSPILLLIGQNDLRVPPKQGFMLHHLLKARNVPTKLYLYEDNHPISKTPHDGDVFMQTAMWFLKYSS